MSRRLAGSLIAAAVMLAVPASASAGDLTLHPSGFGSHTYAAWKANQGEADGKGNANQALYFQKMVPTPTFTAAFAVIKGLEGQPTSSLSDLAFDWRMDGHCGAGAPRFNLTYDPGMGGNQTLFVGCQGMLPGSAQESGWERRTFSGPFPPGTIVSLSIAFDEGNDIGPGFVFLDNIQVNQKIWRSAGDNGNG
jgi:hypothetical protein